MKSPSIALISLQNTSIDFGVRYVASSCRAAGIRTNVAWMVRETPLDPIESETIDALIQWLKEQDFTAVGIGLMSIHFGLACQVTEAIKKHLQIPVIWGGIQPILSPETCLEHAEYVCTGDGELSLPEWVKAISENLPTNSIPNIWRRTENGIEKSERQLIQDLDELPSPDYDLDFHVLATSGKVVPFTVDHIKQFMPWNLGRHYLISSRGCPFECTYCCNSALKNIFGQQHSLRIRSVDNVFGELNDIHSRFPFVEIFAIMDDAFFFKPKGWIEEFCARFPELERKFGVLVHPKSVTRERMEMLVKAGLVGVQMGLQSGAPRVSREVFKRPEPVSDFVKAANVMDEFMDRMMARTYDIIVDNPYETDEEQAETVLLLSFLSKPFHLDLFSLTLYPGTELYERALKDKPEIVEQLKPENKDFLNIQPTQLNRLMWLTHISPGWVIRFFLRTRHAAWGRALFYLYDNIWERSIRRGLSFGKRKLLKLIF